MRKRKVLFFCLGAGLVLTAVLWAIFRDREPAYEGRTLSEWADRLPDDETSVAIRHMGTNTFPVILKWLRYEPAPWKWKVLNRLMQAREWIPTPNFVVSWLEQPFVSPFDRANRVLTVLKEEAAVLAPDLLKLSYDKSGVHGSKDLEGLASMGAAGLPYLTTAVRDPAHPYRVEAAWAMRTVLMHEPFKTNAIQVLSELTADPDVRIREAASTILSPWRNRKAGETATEVFIGRKGITNQVFRSVAGNPETQMTNGITNSFSR